MQTVLGADFFVTLWPGGCLKATLNRRWNFPDSSKGQGGTTWMEPGTYDLERIPYPFPEDAVDPKPDWLVFVDNATVGAAVGWWDEWSPEQMSNKEFQITIED